MHINTYNYLNRYYPMHIDNTHAPSFQLRTFKAGVRPALNLFYIQLLDWCYQHITDHTLIMAVPSSDCTRTNSITKIASAVGKRHPLLHDATHAIRKTHSTASFCRSNTRNADALNCSISINADVVANQHILLVDDVTTTGTTFTAITDMLLDAGAASVTCLALAKSCR